MRTNDRFGLPVAISRYLYEMALSEQPNSSHSKSIQQLLLAFVTSAISVFGFLKHVTERGRIQDKFAGYARLSEVFRPRNTPR